MPGSVSDKSQLAGADDGPLSGFSPGEDGKRKSTPRANEVPTP